MFKCAYLIDKMLVFFKNKNVKDPKHIFRTVTRIGQIDLLVMCHIHKNRPAPNTTRVFACPVHGQLEELNIDDPSVKGQYTRALEKAWSSHN